jgi:ribosomal protein L11 methyltransferase
MATYKAKILASKADAELLADLVSEILDPPPAVSLGEAEGGWLVELYFTEPPDPAGLSAVADAAPHFSPVRDLTLELLPEENWVEKTQRGLHPIVAGRFFVHGSHDRDKAQARNFAIEIDAGQAFGTAHHGTTRGCLMLIDRVAKRGGVARVLDLGTGSGVLAIASAAALRRPVLATDIDPIAIRVAKGNIVGNGAAGRVKAVVADGLGDPVIEASAPFDLITANILAEPLIRFAPAIARITASHGHLILSGMLDHQAREVLARYLLAGFRLSSKLSLEGWTTLLLQRSS